MTHTIKYVDAGTGDPDRPLSGVLGFLDPRAGQTPRIAVSFNATLGALAPVKASPA